MATRLRAIPLVLFAAASLGALTASLVWPGGPAGAIAVPGGESDLSAATWDDVAGVLWIARQDGRVWTVRFEGDDGFVATPAGRLPPEAGSDFEAIAQVEQGSGELYVLAEDQGRIARVKDVAGAPRVVSVWNLERLQAGRQLPPERRGLGAEGLEFVPDADLVAAGFRLPDGAPFAGSRLGLGGLLFVGHQQGGRLYVFDVNPDVSDVFENLGSFATAADEIAGLHYDRSLRAMSLWHGTLRGNSLEVSRLTSDRSAGTIDVLFHFTEGMPTGNLEGVAFVSASRCGAFGAASSGRVGFLTRDGGTRNLEAFAALPCAWVERPAPPRLLGHRSPTASRP